MTSPIRRLPMRVRTPLVLVAFASACASAPPPAAPPPPPPPVVVAPKPEPEPPAVKVLMKLTLAHPRKSFGALETLLSGNPTWQKASATLSLLGMGLAASVDVDRPAFLAMAENKEFAVSLDIVPGQAAKLADRFHLAPSSDGSYRSAHDGLDEAKGRPFACGITPVVTTGSAPTPSDRLRLVCSTDAPTVQTFAPVLARMAADEAGADVRLEMSGDPIRTAMIESSQNKPQQSTAAKAKGAALGEKIVADLANDLDGVVWEGSLHGDAEATMTFRFRSDKSPFVHALTAHPERAAPPTSAFWHLPITTDMAFFAQGAAASDLEGVKAVLWSAMDDALKEDSCDEGVAYFDERIHALFLTGGPAVMGIGNDVPAAEKALKTYRALKKPTDAARAVVRQALATWVLFEVDEPSTKWISGFKELLLMDKKFAKCEPSHPVPGVTKEKKKEESTTVEVPVPASAHLPKGTFHFANHSKPTKDATSDTPPAHTTHVYMVPDGEHTWFAIGDNDAMVLAKVKAALHDAPTAGTLAARPGLDAIHAAAAGGGFLTAEGITAMRAKDLTDEDLHDADTKLTETTSLPSKGVLPVPIWWRTTSSEVSLRVLVPQTALRELLTLLK